MARILVVDDEPHIREVVEAYLTRDGHAVVTAADGLVAVGLARELEPDLIVLDVMLPGRSGFDVLRDLRSDGVAAAVILLTARDDVIDRVAGLEIGADDYLTKPFEPRELVARVGAILRRTSTAATATPIALAEVPDEGPRRLADIDIDPAGREAAREGVSLGLTRVEFDLLTALTEHPGVVLTRERLGEHLFGEAFDAFDRTIDSHVKNLRRKLGPRPGGAAYIETVRGVGYRAARS